jgi:hypothetical protein
MELGTVASPNVLTIARRLRGSTDWLNASVVPKIMLALQAYQVSLNLFLFWI